MRRIYVVLVLLLAIAIPMAVKYSINHANVHKACNDGPCLINNFSDFSNDPLQERHLPNNLEKMSKPDAFQPNLDNHPKDEMINMDGFQEDSANRVGQKCEFGLCLPGQQQPGNRQD